MVDIINMDEIPFSILNSNSVPLTRKNLARGFYLTRIQTFHNFIKMFTL